jgi:transcription initiation factor TFIID subunit 5
MFLRMANKNDLLAVLQVLKKYNLKGTENILKQEANLSENDYRIEQDSVLQAYQSEGDPNSYATCYVELRKFVDSALDIYKVS